MRRAAWLVLVGGLVGGCGHPDAGPCAGPALTKGPWVMRPGESGASIFWETRDPGCVEVGVTATGGSEAVVVGSAAATTVASSYGVETGARQPDLAGTYYVARVDVSGLDAGRCYPYRVRQAGADDARGRLCTARAAADGAAWKFMAIGDTNPLLGHTKGSLDHVLPEQPELVVHVGDIHYYSSTETWAYWFGAMAPMLRAAPFMPAIGNHEDETQFEATDFADYYDRLFHQPSLDGTPAYFRFAWNGIWFHAVDTEAPYDSGSPQYQWLASSLAEVQGEPGFRFSVVYMHRNLYTLGDSAPQVDQRRSLGPEFAAHKVRLVLSGHMHGYERFEVGDITYVTTAGGGGVIGDVNANVPNYPMDVPLRVAAAPAYHAMIFDVAPVGASTMLHGRAIDELGRVIDEFTHLVE
jgi:hypothetical protein